MTSSITQGIIDSVLHPTIGALSLTPFPLNPYFGVGDIMTFNRPTILTSNVDAYGIGWSFDFIPERLSKRLGAQIVWADSLMQLVVVHRMRDGTLVATQIEEIHIDGGLFTFNIAAPEFISAFLLPGVIVNLFWATLVT